MQVKDLPQDFKNALKDIFNFNYFDDRDFRKVNIDFFNEVVKNRLSGIVDVTCGVGKTVMQSIAIAYTIKYSKDPVNICISSHRLLLDAQLINEILHIVNVNPDNTCVYWMCTECQINYKNELASEERYNGKKFKGGKVSSIPAFYKDVNSPDTKNKNHILVTTQTSLQINKFQLNDKKYTSLFDLFIVDECHKNLKNEVKNGIINASKQHLFFTATVTDRLKKSCSNIIFQLKYSEAKKCGYIVGPYLYEIVNTNANIKDDINGSKNFADIATLDMMTNYKTSRTLIFENSIAEANYTAEHLSETYNNKIIDNDVVIYQFTSKTTTIDKQEIGLCKKYFAINGRVEYRVFSKTELLKELKHDKTQHIIIVNAEMINEGIDIPSINAVILLCNKRDANLYQAIMRGCRKALGKDHYNIYVPSCVNDEYEAEFVNDFIKNIINQTEGDVHYAGEVSENGRNTVNREPNANKNTKYKKVEDIYIELKNEFDKKQSAFEQQVYETLAVFNVTLDEILSQSQDTRKEIYDIIIGKISNTELTYEETNMVKNIFNI